MKQAKNIKAILISSILCAGIFTAPLGFAKNGELLEARTTKACEVLEDAHAALTVLRVNSDEALHRVELALDTIEKLDNKFDDYSSVKAVNEDSDSVNYVYQHYYPEISGPDNYCSNYVYLDLNSHESLNSDDYSIYLDYPLAKAELITAKLAIENGDALEARHSLKRSMQAIYINPSFNIAK